MKKRLILLFAVCSLVLSLGVATAVAVSSSSTRKMDLNYAPDVTIDYGSYSESTVPNAVINAKYKLFSATAEDVYGKPLTVTSRAYIHYGEPNMALITIERGEVTPKYYGRYTVEYSACDEFGNVGYATYDFVCEEVANLTVSLGGEFASSVQAGKVAKIKTVEYSNAIGDVTVEITAKRGSDVTYDLTGETSFVPLYTGDYSITYRVYDYSRSASSSYTLSVTENSGAIISEEPVLPKYFIKGKTYTLPTAKCYNLSSGSPVEVAPTVSYKYGSGSYSAVSGNSLTVNNAGNVTVKYAVSGDAREYVVKAVDTGLGTNNLDMSKYFSSSTAVWSKTSSNMTCEVKTAGEKVEFINPLESHKFELNFSIPTEYKNFEKLNLFLESSKDSEKVLKITYSNTGEKTAYVTINDTYKYKTDSFDLDKSIEVVYNDSDRTLKLGTWIKIDLSNVESFEDERVYFSFSLEGLNGKSGISVATLSNQAMTNAKGDGEIPKVYFDVYPKGYETIGKTVTVGRVFVCDVLDPDYTVAYSIKKPSGGYVVDINGTTLNNVDYTKDYSFVVSEYGRYVVRISVSDSSGNEEVYAYNVTVVDLEGPNVTLKASLKDDLRVGEAFTVRGLNVTDNKSSNFTISAYVIKPNMKTQSVNVGSAYAFKSAGQYVLCYVVKDEDGNVTILTHTFNVG